MSERDKARPVSGEIMTGASGVTGPSRDNFSEAEVVSVEPPRHGKSTTPSPQPSAEGMDVLKASATPPSSSVQGSRGGPLFWTTGLALVALAFWVSGGHALVRQSLPAIGAEQRDSLRIVGVTSKVENRDGRDILLVSGEVRNSGRDAETMRPIEITVVDQAGRATRYFLGTRADDLAPGNRYSFSSRIEAPRNGVKSVSVSFQEGMR